MFFSPDGLSIIIKSRNISCSSSAVLKKVLICDIMSVMRLVDELEHTVYQDP